MSLAIIGTAAAGGVVGFLGGFWIGLQEGGDLNFAPAIYAPMGAAIGCFGGAVLGAVLFA